MFNNKSCNFAYRAFFILKKLESNNQLKPINEMNNFIYFLENNFFAEELVDLYNEYADSVRYERLNDIENINEDLSGLKPNDIINMIVYGEYNSNDSYYTFDGYGNIQTISENNIIEYIVNEVDNEEFYTFLVDKGFFSESEYKLYLKGYPNS